MIKKIISWKHSYGDRIKYSTGDRQPFFKVAASYLPKNREDVIIDLGPGSGDFAEYCDANSQYDNFYLLDGNQQTVSELSGRYKNVKYYTAPDQLPFDDCTVSYIHCSHIMEHLFHHELYKLLKEIDRVLKIEGCFIVSGPLLWRNFYFDMSHVKPYYPETINKYFCFKSASSTREHIFSSYKELELVYRYDKIVFDDQGVGSEIFILDFFIQSLKKILVTAKICSFSRNGFTLVLQKISSVD